VLFYIKMAVGTPLPLLMSVALLLAPLSDFISMGAFAICSFATLFYITTDRLMSQQEFRLSRVGPDLALILLWMILLISTAAHGRWAESRLDLAWVPLVYGTAFTWMVFPGLWLRLRWLGVGWVGAVGWGWFQHFTGQTVVFAPMPELAPLQNAAVHQVTLAASSSWVVATQLLLLTPFALALTVDWDNRRWSGLTRLAGGLIYLASGVVVLWTYSVGAWSALALSSFVGATMAGRKWLRSVVVATLPFMVAPVLIGSSPWGLLGELQTVQSERMEALRPVAQAQIQTWKQAPVFGAGPSEARAGTAAGASEGNLYLELLARHGLLGLLGYLLFCLSLALWTYRTLREVPRDHDWHRLFVSSALSAQLGFHLMGLYYVTWQNAGVLALLALQIGTVGYIWAKYADGLVPDDQSL
jgi:hypothetical protein